MKRILIASATLIIIIFCLPLFLTGNNSSVDEPAPDVSEFVPYTEYNHATSDLDPASGDSFDRNQKVTVSIGGEPCEMYLYDYLCGVVSAEMPAKFEQEALRSQAVAARTYTLYKMGLPYSENHPDCAVCDDVNCCKAYISPETQQERWGGEYATYSLKISSAVSDTDGVAITYESEPILAAFHSSSSGKTASSSEVWGSYLPYLVSVDSPEDPDSVPNYITTVEVPFDEFKSIVMERYPAASLGDDPADWLVIEGFTASGRVENASIGGVLVSGNIVRGMFSLRSATFTCTVSDSAVVFTTAGYGHGVGMSQYGANILAAQGLDYREILTTYYPGTELLRFTLS